MRFAARKCQLLAAAIGFAPLAAALGQKQIISFISDPDAFQVAGGAISQPQILVSSNEYWGVIRAAGDLAKDFGRVTGTNFTLSNGEAGAEPAAYEYKPITRNYTHVSQECMLSSISYLVAGFYLNYTYLNHHTAKPSVIIPNDTLLANMS